MSSQQAVVDVAKATADAAENSAKADEARRNAEVQASEQLDKDKAAAFIPTSSATRGGR